MKHKRRYPRQLHTKLKYKYFITEAGEFYACYSTLASARRAIKSLTKTRKSHGYLIFTAETWVIIDE